MKLKKHFFIISKDKYFFKTRFILPILAILLFGGISYGILNFIRLNRCRNYACLFFPGKENWKIKEVYNNENNSWSGLISTPNYLLRIEKRSNLDVEDANSLTTINLMRIKGLSDRARSPYPGIISDEISCSDIYKPIEKKLTAPSGLEIIYLSAFTNSRMQYGVCTDDQIAYHSFVSFFYCQNIKEWYQIELITSKKDLFSEKEYDSIMKKIKC